MLDASSPQFINPSPLIFEANLGILPWWPEVCPILGLVTFWHYTKCLPSNFRHNIDISKHFHSSLVISWIRHFKHSEHFLKMLTFSIAWPNILNILTILWKCCQAKHFEHSGHFVKMLQRLTFWTFWPFCENVARPNILNILTILWECCRAGHFGHSEHLVKMLLGPTFRTFWPFCENVAWPNILNILNILWKCCWLGHFKQSELFVMLDLFWARPHFRRCLCSFQTQNWIAHSVIWLLLTNLKPTLLIFYKSRAVIYGDLYHPLAVHKYP